MEGRSCPDASEIGHSYCNMEKKLILKKNELLCINTLAHQLIRLAKHY